jgi:hypothetical protein
VSRTSYTMTAYLRMLKTSFVLGDAYDTVESESVPPGERAISIVICCHSIYLLVLLCAATSVRLLIKTGGAKHFHR